MKLKYILQGILCSFIFASSSCSLDYEPVSSYSDVTQGEDASGKKVVFKNKADVESHMKLIYNQMKDRQEHWYMDLLVIAEAHSDNAYGGATGAELSPFENNGIDGTNSILKRDWERYLDDVGKANKLILNVDGVKDDTFSKAERDAYKAQALIFRSMILFDMVRIWSRIPLVTYEIPDITSGNIEELYPLLFPKQTEEIDVYKQIETDLIEALKSAPNNDVSDKTLFTKTVARTLLAKIYAEKPLRDYSKVIQYSDAVAADGFDIVNDFSDLFGMNAANTDTKMRNTKESILEAHFYPGSGNWCTWMFGRDLVNWDSNFSWAKWVTPSRDLIKAFEQEGDTKRFNESVVYYSCAWSNYYPAENYPFMYKCRSANSSIIKYRYADVLLLKAEALIFGSNKNLNAAADIIDKIRVRAGLNKLNSTVKGSQSAMEEALLNERRLELAFEGQRWFDLVRLDKVESVMNVINKKDSGRLSLKYAFNKNSYRLPIPQSAMDQNENLEQNAGY